MKRGGFFVGALLIVLVVVWFALDLSFHTAALFGYEPPERTRAGGMTTGELEWLPMVFEGLNTMIGIAGVVLSYLGLRK